MDNRLIYENLNWEGLTSDKLKLKIQQIKDTIPAEVISILDVGCGNGAITNELAQKYQIVGIDRSEQALKFVTGDKICASSDSIPVEDQSFDMVFSSELLEHLNNEVYEKTIHEITRIAKKYIYITVPNGENPEKLAIKCPNCNYIFNKPNHLRGFDIQTLEGAFKDFHLLETFTLGQKVRYYNPKLLNYKLKYTPPTSWIPTLWINDSLRNATCPSCSITFHYSYKFNLVASTIDFLNILISPKKPYWLFAILERKSINHP